MKLFVLSLIISFQSARALEQIRFDDYVGTYQKQYNNYIEYQQKQLIFHENVKRIEELREEHPDLEFAMNEFGDFTMEEFHANMKGFRPSLLHRTKQCNMYAYQESDVPSAWDWRSQGAVASVKNQGQCGSCWSFSAAGAMEGSWAISTGNLVNISEQQLMDCSTKYINFGCNGGEMDHAFEYAIDNGMCLDDEVPYTAESSSCDDSEKACTKVATFTSCEDIQTKDQVAMEEASHFAPLSVAIEADTTVFQFYSGGVLNSDKCGTNLDHGVLVVGYGSEDDQDYWIVKNSWGDSWGEDGYIRIAKSSSTNDDGVCGIAMQPSLIKV